LIANTILMMVALLAQPESSGDSLGAPAEPIPSRNPTGALLRSAVLPGWGQFYNDEYAKGILLGAASTGLLTWLLMENGAANSARDDFEETGDPAFEQDYETHKQRRLDLIWYTSAAWLYTMLDAYVDAHLFAFDIENDNYGKISGIRVGFELSLQSSGGNSP
jgi:hypothetical protein